MTKGDRIRAVRDQHRLGFGALVRLQAEKAGADAPEGGLDAVSHKLVEDGIRGQRTALLDFLGQLL